MFRKLLKYDMRSIFRIWWIVAVIMLGVSLVGAFGLRFFLTYIDRIEESPAILLFGIFLLLVVHMALIASVYVVWIFVFLRFYKNLFTDEGYLTFMLPVRRSTLLATKTLNGCLWMCLHFVLLLVCAMLFMLIGPPAENGLISFAAFEAVGEIFRIAWRDIGAWLILWMIEYVLLLVVEFVCSVVLVQFCITVGSVLVKKFKLLASIGIYAGIGSILSTLWYAFYILFMFGAADDVTYMLSSLSLQQIPPVVALILGLFTVVMATFSCLLYNASRTLIEHKLNLA